MEIRTTKEHVRAFFRMLFYFSITLRFEIELQKNVKDQKPELIAYLSSGKEIDQLIEDKILSKLPFDQLGEHEVLQSIHNDFLNPSGIRKRCLKVANDNQKVEVIGKRN